MNDFFFLKVNKIMLFFTFKSSEENDTKNKIASGLSPRINGNKVFPGNIQRLERRFFFSSLKNVGLMTKESYEQSGKGFLFFLVFSQISFPEVLEFFPF